MADQRENGLRYTHKGVIYPSVTTILDMEPKPWMKGWVSKMVATWAVEHVGEWVDLEPVDAIAVVKGAAEKSRNISAEMGSAIHAYAEAAADRTEGAPDPADTMPKDLVPYCKSFLRFVEDHNPVPVMTERKVFNTKLGYAGTFDSVCTIGGRHVLLDYKTGNSVHGTVAMQLRAYSEGEFIQGEDGFTEEPMPRMDEFLVVHLRPRKYALKVVHAERPEVWRTFRALRAVFDWDRKHSHNMIDDWEGWD